MAQSSPQKVSCLCGADVRIDPLSQNRRITCKACSSTFDFAITLDASKRNSRISLILPPGALTVKETPPAPKAPAAAAAPPAEPVAPPPRAKAPAPEPKALTRLPKKSTGKTMHAIIAKCECGAGFPLEDDGQLTSIQACPQCARTYHVVFKLEPGTRTKVAIIVPEKPIVHRTQQIRTMAAPKPPKSPTQVPKAPQTVKKNRTIKVTRIPAPSAPPPPSEIPAGAQAVPCGCGSVFIVRRKDLEGEKACDVCGKKVRFMEDRDPQTMVPILRIRPS